MINSLPTIMKHDFSRIPKVEIPRSSFDRSHGHKTTFDAGYLIPIFIDEALPGDTFNLSMAAFGRLATPIFPLMDNMHIDTHFFAVPLRLLWTNFERFMGERVNPADSIDYIIPKMDVPASPYFAQGSLADYFGLPILTNIELGQARNQPSALPFRAYNLIYNEWFRDQNLINSARVDQDDGPDDIADYPLRRRGKRHDYFTSCLPFPQKGDAVSIPLGGSADVLYRTGNSPIIRREDTGAILAAKDLYSAATTGKLFDQTNSLNAILDPNTSLYTDLTTATAVTINSLREAFQIQRLLERDARGGTRYTEIIRSHFGVISPDQRLQRPEYLGGGTSRVNITPVPQTADAVATPLGSLAGYGTVSFNGHGFSKSFDEHCIIMGFVSARADMSYQQGINRMWSRSTKFDFYWPALAHIGEQAVLYKEIYAGDSDANDNAAFGYQERYAEYRYKPSQITGLFRSNAAGSLDAWHLCQEFASRPPLNQTFIEENPPFDRVIAVPSEPHFIFDSYFNLKCARPMPMYSVPGFVDHF